MEWSAEYCSEFPSAMALNLRYSPHFSEMDFHTRCKESPRHNMTNFGVFRHFFHVLQMLWWKVVENFFPITCGRSRSENKIFLCPKLTRRKNNVSAPLTQSQLTQLVLYDPRCFFLTNVTPYTCSFQSEAEYHPCARPNNKPSEEVSRSKCHCMRA